MISKFRIHNSEFKQKGLSLIEMTIAIAILIVALLAALALATFGVVAGGESEMRVTAINLAREGVEVVRNKRDSNWIDPSITDWLEDITITGDTKVTVPVFKESDNSWALWGNFTGVDFTDPSSFEEDFLQIYIKNGLYVGRQADWEEKTNFYRALNIVQDPSGSNPDELKVTCYVAYQERSRWHLVNVEEHLFNWY